MQKTTSSLFKMLAFILFLMLAYHGCISDNVSVQVESVCGETVHLPVKEDPTNCFTNILPDSLKRLEQSLLQLEAGLTDYNTFYQIIESSSVKKRLEDLSEEKYYLPLSKYLRYKSAILFEIDKEQTLPTLRRAESLMEKYTTNRCDSIELAQVYSWLSYYHPQIKQKIHYTNKSLESNRKMERIREVAIELSNLAGHYKNIKSSSESDSLTSKAACIWEAVGYTNRNELEGFYQTINITGILFQRKGVIHYQKRELGEARHNFNQALSSFFYLLDVINKDTILDENTKSSIIIPTLLTNIGRIYMSKNAIFLSPKDEELLENTLKSLELQKGTLGKTNKLMIYSLMAFIETKKDNCDKAQYWIERSLENGLIDKSKKEWKNLALSDIVDGLQFVQVLYYKAIVKEYCYAQTGTIDYLKQAVEAHQQTIIFLEKLLEKEDLGNPTESLLEITASYYTDASIVALKLYEVEKSKYYLDLALRTTDRGKNNNLLRNLGNQLNKLNKNEQELQIPTLEEIRENWLDDSTAIIEYGLSYRRGSSYAFVITQEEAKVVTIDTDSLFYQRVTEYSQTIRDSLYYFPLQSYELYDKIFAPIEAVLPKNKIKNLVIIADKESNQLIFQSLLTKPAPQTASSDIDYRDLEYLINDYNISYLPSLSIYQRLRELESDKKTEYNLLGFVANPADWNATSTIHPSLDDAIPFSTGATKKIENYTANSKIYPKTTKKLFFKEAEKAKFLLLTMHGFLASDRDAIKSHISFMPDNNSGNGQLVLKEIEKLTLNAELLFLANCNSGQGTLTASEGIISFARAFMARGCRGTIATMASVEDQKAAFIIERFYHFLLVEQKTIAQSLALAQRAFIKSTPENPHPNTWANYIYTGIDALNY